MTKKQLMEAITDYPDDAKVGLMYNGGDSCSLKLMEFFGKDGSKDTLHVILEPCDKAPISNQICSDELDKALDKLLDKY